ncbi:MAG: hypothetical protein ACD_62C00113G0001, partial [uncultured bacterium]
GQDGELVEPRQGPRWDDTLFDPRSTIHDLRFTIHDPRSTIHTLWGTSDPRPTILGYHFSDTYYGL